MSRLRFLCFNIHGGRSMDGKRDLRRVNALLDEYDIDIGVFQEMETRQTCGGRPGDVDLLAGTERPYRLPGKSMVEAEGWYGNLIVSRYPILRSHVHNLETKPSYEPRCAVDALIETPQGKIRVIGTHLSLSPLERLSETRNLIRLVDQVEEAEKNPLFFMGDLNEWRSNSKLLKHLNELFIPLPCKATFPSFYPLLKLDRAWHDTPLLNVMATTLSNKRIRPLSDHLPVMVEVLY